MAIPITSHVPRATNCLNERFPLYLLPEFAKNERVDLSQPERNDLAKLVEVLIKTALD